MTAAKKTCPDCGSDNVVSYELAAWYVNTNDLWCHSVKPYDSDAKAKCLKCDWEGVYQDLQESRE